MPSKKPMRTPSGTGRQRPCPGARPTGKSLPPMFLTRSLRRSIDRILPVEHYRRLRGYFDKYGCLRCARSRVIYGANGFCSSCIGHLEKRMRKIDKELQAKYPDPRPKLEEEYLRPYNSARELLSDLIPKLGKMSSRKRFGPKAPARVSLLRTA